MNLNPAALSRMLDRGAGARALRTALYAALAAGLFALYAAAVFRGLTRAEAMDCAQLARGLAEGRGYVTRWLRPADYAFLEQAGRSPAPPDAHPELRRPPGFPVLLAGAFRLLRPSFSPPDGGTQIHTPETRVIVPLGILLSLAAGGLLFLLARRLFGVRPARLAVVLFFVSDGVLASAVSGTPQPLSTLLVTAAFYFAVRAAGAFERGGAAWLPGALGAAVCCALLFYVRYRLLVLALPVAAVLAGGAPRHRTTLAAAFLALVLALCVPWLLRNRAVSGAWFGMAPRAALHDTSMYPGDRVERAVAPAFHNVRVARTLRVKFRDGLSDAVRRPLGLFGGGLIAAFFMVSFFHRFDEPHANRLRWCLLGAVALLSGALALSGDAGGTQPLLPLCLAFGAAFFVATADDMFAFTPEGPMLLGWLLVLLTALPAGLRMANRQPAFPYPPVFAPYAAFAAANMDAESDVLATDLPAATAWYGRRPSLLLPASSGDLLAMVSGGLPVRGLYLTSRTGNRPYASALVNGPDASWLPILNGTVPETFPWPHALRLPPGGRDQILYRDAPPPAWQALPSKPLASADETQ